MVDRVMSLAVTSAVEGRNDAKINIEAKMATVCQSSL
jgi:hypothetical protein